MEQIRIAKLEEEVARLSREVDSKSPSREPSLPPSPGEISELRGTESQGKIIPGPATTYLSPFSWAVMSEEMADVETMLGAVPYNVNTAEPVNQDISPSEEQAPPFLDDQVHDLLLTLFSHRVDPLIRVLHWPSFIERVNEYRRRTTSTMRTSPGSQFSNAYYSVPSFDPSQQGIYPNPPTVRSRDQPGYGPSRSIVSSEPAFVTLLHTVYYAAIVSVIESPNPPDLGQNIDIMSLAQTYKRVVANRVLALGGNALRYGSLEALQAMVLALSMEPESFSIQLQWLQLGTAIRMAQGLGVHRDGTPLGLGPIEVEVRRRVWAQICALDARFAELLCREPSISMDSYDAALPLSISDEDLIEIDAQYLASRQGRETKFRSYEEIEKEQAGYSPFSTMSFPLIEAEAARLVQIFAPKYRARDGLFNSASASARSISRRERSQWISRLEHRFQSVYRLNTLSPTNAMQFLVSELASISITKARFVTRLMDRREYYGAMSPAERVTEVIRLFRDAISLATRILALIHQYSNSPYSWYTKRLREAYTSSFLALCLASGQYTDVEDMNAAWSVLDQLFPIDNSGKHVEHGLSGSLFGKVLAVARVRRGTQLRNPHGQELREQPLHAVATGKVHQNSYPASLAQHAAANLPTTTSSVGTYQSSGNFFEDFDAIMQDPMWSASMGSVDNTYGSWVCPSSSSMHS
ncbi:hypothetical protein BDV95DRAFT_602419 [Massariosphaeria phaeospora]|uniref:Xylanolytic transcriptional activator regulatory domain-containing protein n=1 Tax=Massariosphaeria phaeospora TaxID=100035 RepID=A0A7C8MBS8_9PLEO|nr:hypothetical protein BDV95DRAFT_602419 [Massariosphaeria phaeospora]